eukprot:2272386-Rhodomonas_salina.2
MAYRKRSVIERVMEREVSRQGERERASERESKLPDTRHRCTPPRAACPSLRAAHPRSAPRIAQVQHSTYVSTDQRRLSQNHRRCSTSHRLSSQSRRLSRQHRRRCSRARDRPCSGNSRCSV